MTRRAVILVLFLCAWSTGCGAPTVPGAASTKVGPSIAAAESESNVGWHLPLPTLAYNAREGRTVFLHYCAPCHGENGRGDGFNAYNLDPRPRDLADPGFQQTHSDEDLAAIVRTGGGVAGLSNSMPPWGRTLNDRQIHNLVRFIRYLPAQIDHESKE